MPYASVSTMRPPAAPSDSIRMSILPMRKRASWAVSTGISARSSTRGRTAVAPISSHSLNPTRARGSGFERVGKVLGLAGHLAIQELHDAHRIGRPAVIREDEFRDPEVARADDAAHPEALRVRLRDARGLDVVPAPDALARLLVLEQCVAAAPVLAPNNPSGSLARYGSLPSQLTASARSASNGMLNTFRRSASSAGVRRSNNSVAMPRLFSASATALFPGLSRLEPLPWAKTTNA